MIHDHNAYHRVVFCLGSNTSEAEGNVAEAILWLQSTILVSRATSPYLTVPEGVDISGVPYFNALVEGLTSADPAHLILLAKEYERSHGRLPGHKSEGRVIIDIDLVLYDTSIVNPTNFSAGYFRQGLPILFSL